MRWSNFAKRRAAPLLFLLAMPTAGMAGPTYTPTMKDMMSINAAVHRYLEGLDKHDSQALANAFTADGVLMLYDHGKLVTNLHGRAELIAFSKGAMPPPGAGMPPSGAGMPPSGAMPPPGAMPPSGAGMPPSGAGMPPPGAGASMREMFHFITNDYYDFEGPTRMKHYAYWMDVTPGDGRTSTVGIPGHYEDIFEKRGGEWYILERKIFVGTK